ncbi:MAG: hypothetical protein IKW28_11670 [Lachnospiraceae bacterium]|nr:hypothetical protein [Lachnospiraceae bacterium]
MIQILLEVLKRVTIFMVIGKVILNLGVGKGYEKYTKTVIGFMVIVQLWAGVNTTLQLIKEKKIADFKTPFFSQWEQEMEGFEKELRAQQKVIEEQWKEYDKTTESKKEEKGEEGEKIIIENIIIGDMK